MVAEICRRSLETMLLVTQETKAAVAAVAQEPSDQPRVMVVVDVQTSSRHALADRAPAILGSDHGLELRDREAIFDPQERLEVQSAIVRASHLIAIAADTTSRVHL